MVGGICRCIMAIESCVHGYIKDAIDMYRSVYMTHDTLTHVLQHMHIHTVSRVCIPLVTL